MPYYEQYETRRPTLPHIDSADRAVLGQIRSIGLRRLIATELPERVGDVMNSSALSYTSKVPKGFAFTETPPVVRRYRAILDKRNADGEREIDLDTVRSEDLLHMIVTRGPVADPDVIAHFRPDEVTDLNGNGMLEFVDGWGNPIKFKRWAIGFNSPIQPIDGELSSRDIRFSPNGHRLVPLIFSAGPDGQFDILDIEAAYDAFDFDPFLLALDSKSQRVPTGAQGETVLMPVTHSGGVTTFIGGRIAGSVPANAFQTIGCERAESGGALGSTDNIHNHSMPR